jgi:hypothetical protein
MKMIKRLYLYLRFGKITARVVDRIDYVPCEIQYFNSKGETIGYWAYGCFDPNFPYRG